MCQFFYTRNIARKAGYGERWFGHTARMDEGRISKSLVMDPRRRKQKRRTSKNELASKNRNGPERHRDDMGIRFCKGQAIETCGDAV